MDLNLPRSQMSVSQCKFALKESWKGENGLSPAHGPLALRHQSLAFHAFAFVCA